MSGGSFELVGGFWGAATTAGIPGDCDLDGDVDLDDFVDFAGCLAGPAGGLIDPACACLDLNANGDVDLADFAEFQVAFTGG
jgi:hypothetical protein